MIEHVWDGMVVFWIWITWIHLGVLTSLAAIWFVLGPAAIWLRGTQLIGAWLVISVIATASTTAITPGFAAESVERFVAELAGFFFGSLFGTACMAVPLSVLRWCRVRLIHFDGQASTVIEPAPISIIDLMWGTSFVALTIGLLMQLRQPLTNDNDFVSPFATLTIITIFFTTFALISCLTLLWPLLVSMSTRMTHETKLNTIVAIGVSGTVIGFALIGYSDGDTGALRTIAVILVCFWIPLGWLMARLKRERQWFRFAIRQRPR